jgi:hypothetical protein
MNFWPEVLTSVTGVVIGFLFSIVLFYLTERWKRKSERKVVLQNVAKEMGYNIGLLERMREQINDLLQDISVGSDSQPAIYKNFSFGKLQRLFVIEAFNKGLLYEILSPEDINNFDSMLNFFDKTTDEWADDILRKLTNHEVKPNDAHDVFKQLKNRVSEHLDYLRKLKSAVEKAI